MRPGLLPRLHAGLLALSLVALAVREAAGALWRGRK